MLIVEAGLRALQTSVLQCKGPPVRSHIGERFAATSARPRPNSPFTTLHLLQDTHDDVELRANPWRWWLACISVEIIARIKPDPDGSNVKVFIFNNYIL